MRVLPLLRTTTITLAVTALLAVTLHAANANKRIQVLGKATASGSASVTIGFTDGTGTTVSVPVTVSIITPQNDGFGWKTAHDLADTLNLDPIVRAAKWAAVPLKIAGDPAWYITFVKHGGVLSTPFPLPRIQCLTGTSTSPGQSVMGM